MLNYLGTLRSGDGYAGSAINIINSLEQAGVDVRCMLFSAPDPNDASHIKSKPFILADIGLCYGLPNGFTSLINKTKIGFTMFETDKLPNGVGPYAGKTGNVMDIINNLDGLLVPCQHNKDLFISEGCKVPVFVVPLGVTDKFQYIERDFTGKFRFLWIGTFTTRKDPLLIIKSFQELFGESEDVELIIKTSGGVAKRLKVNNNVKIIDGKISEKELLNLYASCHCFVFPSKGEGFGLPPLEAMATGMPTILANNTGMSDFCDSRYNFPLETQKKSPSELAKDHFGNTGNWYNTDPEELKEKMLFVYKQREIAKNIGIKGSIFVKEKYTYHNTALKILEILEKHYGYDNKR